MSTPTVSWACHQDESFTLNTGQECGFHNPALTTIVHVVLSQSRAGIVTQRKWAREERNQNTITPAHFCDSLDAWAMTFVTKCFPSTLERIRLPFSEVKMLKYSFRDKKRKRNLENQELRSLGIRGSSPIGGRREISPTTGSKGRGHQMERLPHFFFTANQATSS